jgi:uncharacterized membrane protein YccC
MTDAASGAQGDGGGSRRGAAFLARLGRAVPLEVGRLSIAAGLRAAVACAVPVLAGEILGQPALSWVSVVAFWGTLADTGGPWRTRFAAMGSLTVFGALACLAAGLVRPHLWLAVPFAFVWCFGAGLVRIYGSAAATVGLLLSVAALVALGLPGHGDALVAADELAALTLAGGLWSMLLVLVIWRLHPYGPARRSVGQCWHALGAYAAALAELHRAGRPAAGDTSWAELARARRSACREAIETARQVQVDTRRGRAGVSRRGVQLLVLLSDADRVFAGLLGLNELLEVARHGAVPPSRSDAATRAVRLALARLAARCEAIAVALDGREGAKKAVAAASDPRDFAATVRRLKRRLAAASGSAAESGGRSGALYPHAADLIERIGTWIEAAGEAVAGARARPVLADAVTERPTADPGGGLSSILAQLRANLRPGSLVFRHALRLAIAAAAAVLITEMLALERGYWVTVTAVSILQPDLSGTWRRAIERVAGSVLGGLIAAGITLVLHRPIEIAAVIVPLSVVTMAVRNVNYALFVLCLTPQFVLVAELFQSGGGTADPTLAGVRALDSVIGGVLGLAAAFLLWPAKEAPYLPERLAEAVRANRDYLATVLAGRLGQQAQGTGPDLAPVRRRAGLASNNAEASLQRLVAEPRRGGAAREIEPGMTIVTCLRRLAGVAAALATLPADGADGPAAAAAQDWIGKALPAIAEALRNGIPPPPLPDRPAIAEGVVPDLPRHELVRAFRQVEVIHAAATRMAANAGAAAH